MDPHRSNGHDCAARHAARSQPDGEHLVAGRAVLVYTAFTALQDVSTDALAVDVLQSHEFERVNVYMFTAKSLGGVIGGAGLGTIIGTVGIRGAFLIQIPILVVIMMVPLFMRAAGEKRFPWTRVKRLRWQNTEKNDKRLGFRHDFGQHPNRLFGPVRPTRHRRQPRHFTGVHPHPDSPLLFLQELGWSQEELNATKGGIILVVPCSVPWRRRTWTPIWWVDADVCGAQRFLDHLGLGHV